MNRKIIFINICYVIGSIFSIVWYLYIVNFIDLKCISNYWIRIAITFLIPIITTFVPKLLKHKLSKDSNNKTISETEIILDLLSTLAICTNVYMIAYYISFNFCPTMIDWVSITIMLFLVTYCFHITIKKLMKTTYSKSIIVVSIIILLGWFNSQELSLIAILSIVLNTIVSIDDRTRLISFLEKKEIGNEFMWKQNIKGGLTEDELKGKFIAQKILIYIIIALMYLIMRFTENGYYSLYIYSAIHHAELNSYPQIIKYLYRGFDRILVAILIFCVLFFNKKIRNILNKIFQPQEPNN